MSDEAYTENWLTGDGSKLGGGWKFYLSAAPLSADSEEIANAGAYAAHMSAMYNQMYEAGMVVPQILMVWLPPGASQQAIEELQMRLDEWQKQFTDEPKQEG